MVYTAWISDLIRKKHRKPLPVLSFPAISLLNQTVYALTHDAEIQAKAIYAIARRCDAAAAVSFMDLSVEAEAFGAKIKEGQNEIPTVTGTLLHDISDVDKLALPEVGAARTGQYLEAVRIAKTRITDRPVLAGMIGPFSLVGRLMEVSEALTNCIADPEFVIAALNKVTPFLVEYAKAYRNIGADGILLAEPLAGLLSPSAISEFSTPFVKKIVQEVQSADFGIIYHNCGPNTPLAVENICTTGAAAFHFGDAVDITKLLDKIPSDKPVIGNISPANCFLRGTPESMTEAVKKLLSETEKYPNFILSSGCDIPPASSWDNIDAFFKAALV